MNEQAITTAGLLDRIGKIREILGLIGQLRGIREPLTDADGLRQSLDVLGRLAERIGIDADWIERITSILLDEDLFNVILAIVRLLAGFVASEQAENTVVVAMADGTDAVVEVQAFVDWLPLIVQILDLLREIRR